MKAIYRGRLAHVTDERFEGVVLDGDLFVSYGDMALVVDPTDAQVEAAKNGDEIPLDPEDEREFTDFLKHLAGEPPNPTVIEALRLWERERPKQIQRR